MSHQLGRLVSEILSRYFGEIVQKVGHDLFIYGSKPIAMITKSTGLTRTQVTESLRTLLKFDLATFEPSVNDLIADYKLVPDNVLLLIRYPRYLFQMKSKYGTEAELLVEELLQNGICTATMLVVTIAIKYKNDKSKYGTEAELLVEELLQNGICTATMLVVTIAIKYKNDKEKNITTGQLKDTFVSLATAAYIQQAPVAELKEGSEVPTLTPVATIVPELDAKAISNAVNSGDVSGISDSIYWKVNYDRFHQDFRDEIMIKAMTRRIDENAGELMRLLLQQMYLTSSAWAAESNPVSTVDLREASRLTDKPLLHQYLEPYLSVLEELGGGVVVRIGAGGGGQWAVRGEVAAQHLAATLADHLVTERRGSKAARIFRLIRTKKYIEEDDIQKHAMLPNKECKELTYKLLEEHFISAQPMRKAASAGALAKAIYLYHINMWEVAHTAQEMCYRSLHNVVCVGASERSKHGRLLDKQRRVRSLLHTMRLRGDPQQNIDDVEETLTPPERALLASIEKRLKQLSAAELELDKALFVLNWYFMYPHT